jgi:probable rRNA maturation factor
MAVLIAVADEAWHRLPGLEDLAERAVSATLVHACRMQETFEISILFAGDEEAARMNGTWRNRTYAPNVLSFPAAAVAGPAGEARPLGDIVLAAGVVAREAVEQGKSLEAHTMHLIIHGTLHLLGFDHLTDADASAMEKAEIAILNGFGYPDPYEQ